ncbi:MAG TPA: glycosyltransferase, partial [Aggregatilinea sp.]|uniref:glycosyltransferase family 2 protein n=1 Tax=Aggregatilinea sp. TaxID=2806333 RepID=UPI002B967396
MNEVPRVSIVMPTYNGERFLAESIQSCLDQTFTDWELIVVDDASTDGTRAIAERFAAQDSRITVLHHDTNKKLPQALNTGYEATRGEYISWTSDDNHYRPAALAEMVDYLDAHPEAAAVYTDFTLMDDQGQPGAYRRVQPTFALMYKQCVGQSFLHRRSLWKAVGRYADDVFLAEDYDFWLRASAHGELHPLHRDLYLYRMHGGTLTSNYRPQVMLAREKTLARNLPLLKWPTGRDRAEGYMHLASLA